MEMSVCTDSFDEREIVLCLARVHPLDVPRLLAAGCQVLTVMMGIPGFHPVFDPLAEIQTGDELLVMDWQKFADAVCVQSSLSPGASVLLLEHIRVFCERAVQHAWLYQAKSGSTLRLLALRWLPHVCPPRELVPVCVEFAHAVDAMDMALRAGRRALSEFQGIALEGGALARLCALLERAKACYGRYSEALQRADEFDAHIRFYLSWQQPVEVEKKQGVTHAA